MWSSHKPDCICSRCEESAKRETAAQADAERVALERAVFEAAMALHEARVNASTADVVTRALEEAMDVADDAHDDACNAMIVFQIANPS